jgi:hypothetical protein
MMTGMEALEAIRLGRKVRRIDWKTDTYAAVHIDNKYMHKSGIRYHVQNRVSDRLEVDQFMHDDWEEVE